MCRHGLVIRNVAASSFVLFSCCCSPSNAEQVIYDSTQGYHSSLWQANPGVDMEFGAELILSGTARTLTRVEMGVALQGLAGTVDLKASVWVNDGPSGTPGTLLWESAWLNDVTIQGVYQMISFNVPYLTVPDHITATVAENNCTTIGAHGVPLSPTAVGTTVRRWVRHNEDEWNTASSAPDTPMIRITAVPEPATLALLTLGGLAVIRRRKKQRT